MLQGTVTKVVICLVIVTIVSQGHFTSIRGDPAVTDPAFGIKRIFTESVAFSKSIKFCIHLSGVSL